MRVFSDRLFKRSHGGGGGGGGVHRVADVEGGGGRGWGGQQFGGGQQNGGGMMAIVGERGSTVGVGCLQPLRTALYTIGISLRNSLS